ncbi:hypothetical protein IQ258_22495 [Coleofasciculus sp. LEGE 07081]|uniref:hypothetical protein n=1 Tax=Coleofasciculus sp. LEGE 07081 TaxID=2777967 RepID=UPI00188055DA|nr:hypothetical protein [Coleofasciculus sp. LEGE 07081]MBE9128837.1 hypothetical protein [Coleofasciculus sp. LEGE 07081]
MIQLFDTFALVEVQGYEKILPNFRVQKQLSRRLKVPMAKDCRFVQQALFILSLC